MERTFIVPGEPRGKGRPRFARRGNFVATHPDDMTVNYENLVKTCYCDKYPNECFEQGVPLETSLVMYYKIPQSTSKKKKTQMLEGTISPTKKPDCDNIEKIIFDALNSIAYYDDAQIVKTSTIKLYSELPRVVVTIKEYEPNGIE